MVIGASVCVCACQSVIICPNLCYFCQLGEDEARVRSKFKELLVAGLSAGSVLSRFLREGMPWSIERAWNETCAGNFYIFLPFGQ